MSEIEIPQTPTLSAGEAVPAPKRRGRPLGSKNQKSKKAPIPKGKPGRKPKAVGKSGLAIEAALSGIRALVEDTLAISVHGASPSTRTVIASILRAGI